jgi:cell division initiation protein
MTDMDLTPQAVAGAQFSTVRKGYDPDEVRAFLAKVARGIDGMQSAAGAADARATSAEAEVTRLRDSPAEGAASGSETEQMSRILMLAQRTADAAVGEAQEEARGIVGAADEKARTTVADAESRAAEVLAAARAEAQEAGEAERVRVAEEVAALEQKRTALAADVERLDAQMAAGRRQLTAVVESLRPLLDAPANRGVAEPTLAPPSVDAPAPSLEPPAPVVVDPEPAALATAEPDAGESPTVTATAAPAPSAPIPVGDEITGEFEPVSPSGRDELRDALADRFFDQGTFEDDRWKPKA